MGATTAGLFIGNDSGLLSVEAIGPSLERRLVADDTSTVEDVVTGGVEILEVGGNETSLSPNPNTNTLSDEGVLFLRTAFDGDGVETALLVFDSFPPVSDALILVPNMKTGTDDVDEVVVGYAENENNDGLCSSTAEGLTGNENENGTVSVPLSIVVAKENGVVANLPDLFSSTLLALGLSPSSLSSYALNDHVVVDLLALLVPLLTVQSEFVAGDNNDE